MIIIIDLLIFNQHLNVEVVEEELLLTTLYTVGLFNLKKCITFHKTIKWFVCKVLICKESSNFSCYENVVWQKVP